MQDGFLFDSDKQRGVGCDALCADDSRLKCKWIWNPYGKRQAPIQNSYAELENSWSLKVTFWHSHYEASVQHGGDSHTSYDIRGKEFNYDKDSTTLKNAGFHEIIIKDNIVITISVRDALDVCLDCIKIGLLQ